MTILLASDDKFIQHCSVMVTSVLMNNPETEFYLFTEGLKAENEALLRRQVSRLGGTLHICKIEKALMKDFPMPSYMSSHITIATYYRLFAARLLPGNIYKVIYLDCDIVVNGSLRELWDYPIDNYALGAVYQSHEVSDCLPNGIGNHAYSRLGLSKESGYFNAGVLLMNLKYWREHNVTERLFGFIRDHSDLIHAHDQDVLNAVLYNETAPLSPRWNYREEFMYRKSLHYPLKTGYTFPVHNPIVIHYVSTPKPWQYYCKNRLKALYYQYIEETPFTGYKPKWTWKEYKHFVLTPHIVKTLIAIDFLKIRKLIEPSSSDLRP